MVTALEDVLQSVEVSAESKAERPNKGQVGILRKDYIRELTDPPAAGAPCLRQRLHRVCGEAPHRGQAPA